MIQLSQHKLRLIRPQKHISNLLSIFIHSRFPVFCLFNAAVAYMRHSCQFRNTLLHISYSCLPISSKQSDHSPLALTSNFHPDNCLSLNIRPFSMNAWDGCGGKPSRSAISEIFKSVHLAGTTIHVQNHINHRSSSMWCSDWTLAGCLDHVHMWLFVFCLLMSSWTDAVSKVAGDEYILIYISLNL